MIAPLIEQEIAIIGGRDVEVLLQDYDHLTLVRLPGERPLMGAPRPIDGALAGRAFQTDVAIERKQTDGVHLFVPLLDGTDRLGVLVFTLDTVDDHDRRWTRRPAGLVADMLITRSMYADRFFQARRRGPISLSAEVQWQLLPPHSWRPSPWAPTGTPDGSMSGWMVSMRPWTKRSPASSEPTDSRQPRWRGWMSERGYRVLFFTDGVVEEDRTSGGESGETRLRNLIEQVGDGHEPVQETVRLLSRALMFERGGVTTDDATFLLLETREGTGDILA